MNALPVISAYPYVVQEEIFWQRNNVPEPLSGGTELGRYRNGRPPLVVIDNQNREVTGRYLQFSGNRILTRVPVVPSMFTRDVKVILQDCLGYIMEPYAPSSAT